MGREVSDKVIQPSAGLPLIEGIILSDPIYEIFKSCAFDFRAMMQTASNLTFSLFELAPGFFLIFRPGCFPVGTAIPVLLHPPWSPFV